MHSFYSTVVTRLPQQYLALNISEFCPQNVCSISFLFVNLFNAAFSTVVQHRIVR